MTYKHDLALTTPWEDATFVPTISKKRKKLVLIFTIATSDDQIVSLLLWEKPTAFHLR